MRTHRPELADVFRTHQSDFLARWNHVLSREQRKALRNIRDCRTAALGGHLHECDRCGHRVILYNSCRNRHCPKCQARARAQWLAQRETELLPVPYFHVIFTLPQHVGQLALQNPKPIYTILFRAAANTLLETAADPRLLGASIGFLAVLHTWGQNLHLHPHLHCVVPGGGISPDGSGWIACRKTSFFLPVRLLSHRFRKKFLRLLRRAFRQGTLRFTGELQSLASPAAFETLCKQAATTDWVVHIKPPFGGPQRVLKYLARYTHRVAISNARLRSLEKGHVTFDWKNYARGGQKSTMTLDAVEFIRRFLLHVLPSGFVRIRQFGFLANRVRHQKLEQCRALLLAVLQPTSTDAASIALKTQDPPVWHHCLFASSGDCCCWDFSLRSGPLFWTPHDLLRCCIFATYAAPTEGLARGTPALDDQGRRSTVSITVADSRTHPDPLRSPPLSEFQSFALCYQLPNCIQYPVVGPAQFNEFYRQCSHRRFSHPSGCLAREHSR